MKGYDDSRSSTATHIETEQVFDDFGATESERSHRDSPAERARKIARLKAEVNSGSYEPDVMDIARLLTSAMDPTL
ncbi:MULTISPECIES: flagellar biosynthesis anti-sigma factor FlgM [unclassified Pseudodesulfovibrio]|uniref:flagellar biosynthesis anti-sigma factor FlgM n=1 Tax=unclassified Pseudodesulfovibrio TaxID=2661612 RepID=UPI000FEBD40A|nr:MULTISPECIES: flagellar biosynthesis anti-sigma factor FlgM [unclassified Pseudodesulfovibrio]MCJ2165682.1 flagellar biosynthesis anti-sigma factor FlgM [Pseudodesulfovibrio sp. S3-i]RWU02946.1 flagellar biosynthesis anti-sigma factor FlgM [Pseudodesulfovibrio sp. S3]